MEKQDFLSAAVYNNRELLEEWLMGNDTTNITFLNEVLLKASHYGSNSVVELLSPLGKTLYKFLATPTFGNLAFIVYFVTTVCIHCFIIINSM